MITDKIIRWPNDSNNYETFHHACDDAIINNKTIEIDSNTCITIDNTILIKSNSKTLIIRGKCNHINNRNDNDDRPVIIGSGHSVFQIGGRKTSLVIENVMIVHNCTRSDKADIGACVFGLYRSTISIDNCSLTSNFGFSVWAVQQCIISISNSHICSKSRSGCVIFGKSKATFNNVIIDGCKQHGLCSRGETIVTINNSTITNSGVRGVYGYHNVTLTMLNCIVSNTMSKNASAIDCWSISNYDATGILLLILLILSILIHPSKTNINSSI
jgi:hypothetical protein